MDVKTASDGLRALAHETRLEVFRLLMARDGEGLPAGEIARRVGTPQNTMSSHLKALHLAGLLSARRESRSVIYSIDLDGSARLFSYLMQDCCGGRVELCLGVLTKEEPRPS